MYDERKKEILKLLAARGYMTVEELAQHLYISEPTIRRDLHNLAKEGVIKRAMRENADSMVLLMDHSKMGEINYYQVFEVPEINILITDAPLPEDLAELCDKKGVEVIIV